LARRDQLEAAAQGDWLDRAAANLGLGAVVLVALAALPVLPTLFAPFFADDYFHVDVASRVPDSLFGGWVLPVPRAGAWWTPPALAVEYFRPVVVLFFALDHAVYGLHPAGYHLTNLLIVAGTTALVWGIARHMLGPGLGAWAAAALFAIHPCHAGAADWISGRTDLLAGAFYAAAFFLYLESQRRRATAVPLFVLALASFALALLSKEMAITLPAMMLLHAGFFLRGSRSLGVWWRLLSRESSPSSIWSCGFRCSAVFTLRPSRSRFIRATRGSSGTW
jgi:hypothetical protein